MGVSVSSSEEAPIVITFLAILKHQKLEYRASLCEMNIASKHHWISSYILAIVHLEYSVPQTAIVMIVSNEPTT